MAQMFGWFSRLALAASRLNRAMASASWFMPGFITFSALLRPIFTCSARYTVGTVYLAEHVKMGRKSALKVMNPGMNQDADAIARFNREAANASRLNHPNICAIYDFGETPDGLIYLAMEFIEGQSLTALIEKSGSLPPARAASIIHQSADALQVAHDAGIVHRDLKPDNIMIAKNRDGSDLAKVVDFGIAKAHSSDAQKVTKTGLVVGTPAVSYTHLRAHED